MTDEHISEQAEDKSIVVPVSEKVMHGALWRVTQPQGRRISSKKFSCMVRVWYKWQGNRDCLLTEYAR